MTTSVSGGGSAVRYRPAQGSAAGGPALAGKVHCPTGCRQCESSEHRLCHGQRHGHGWQRLRADYGDLDLCSGRDNETVGVPVLDDLVGEPTENFQLNLSNAVNATSADS